MGYLGREEETHNCNLHGGASSVWVSILVNPHVSWKLVAGLQIPKGDLWLILVIEHPIETLNPITNRYSWKREKQNRNKKGGRNKLKKEGGEGERRREEERRRERERERERGSWYRRGGSSREGWIETLDLGWRWVAGRREKVNPRSRREEKREEMREISKTKSGERSGAEFSRVWALGSFLI